MEREFEICTQELCMHERVGDSKHFAQAFRGLSDIDWGMLKMKFGEETQTRQKEN